MSGAAAAARTIVPVTANGGDHDTDLPTSVTAMLSNNYITQAGNGLSSAAPKKAVFLITDGTNDYGSNGTISPFDTSQCDKIKALGADLYVMYTVYYPIPSYYPNDPDTPPGRESWYNFVYQYYVMPLQGPPDQITSNLQSCASSPDKFISVSDSASLKQGLAKLLQAALATPGRLTQ